MRPPAAACLPAAVILAALARPALAADPPPAAPTAAADDEPPTTETPPGEPLTGFLDRFVLETGRIEPKPVDAGSVSVAIHGEYQLRYRAMSDLPLEPPIGQPSVNTLGQNQYLYHWLRLGLRIQIGDKVAVVMQADIPRGMIVGDVTEDVTAARDSLSATQWYGVYPRYLYVEYKSPVGVFRLGQQGSQWGMGIVANDGDHPTLFDDYRRGSLVERILYATTPLGEGTPLVLALGGDLVFQDATADLLSGDRAFEAFGAAQWKTRSAEIGVYGVARQQSRNATSVDTYTPFVETLTAGVVDVSGRFDAPVPGSTSSFVYGQMEAATIFGSTTFIRGAWGQPINPTGPRPNELIRSYGGAATLGATRVSGEGSDRWGSVDGEVEVGYASGDANPTDGVSKRFTFDENHHVGLVLFDQVLRWKTARSATIAQDPAIVGRAAPGLEFLPSNGGVFGAEYINPRFVLRPRRWVDLKGGVVIAQTTADFVDPFQYGVLGNARNYDGGDPTKHDLGVELDVGAAFRVPLERYATIQAGVEGGVLFPGHAFDDAQGNRLPNQYLTSVQLGLQF
jgi:hypothetical protein